MRKTKKLLEESQSMLQNIVGADEAASIMENMFPKPISGYKKGNLLTVGQLKNLPENSIIHLWYKDDDGSIRENGFKKILSYEDECSITTDGYSMPLENHSDDELIERFDNSGWKFTVCEAVVN